MALAVLFAGCSSGGDAAPASETSTTAADLANVTVPDAYTGLVLAPIGDPTFPFLGSDGKYHVAYDLQLRPGHLHGGSPVGEPNGEDEPLGSSALRDSSRSSIPMQD